MKLSKKFLTSVALAVIGTGNLLAIDPPPPSPNTACANTYSAVVTCTDGCGNTISVIGYGGTQLDADNAAAANALVDPRCAAPSHQGSLIDLNTMNHRHDATDWAPSSAAGGCSSCGGTPVGSPVKFATLAVTRTQSLREITEPSSFGPGMFLDYDASLSLFDYNGASYVDCFNPLWLGVRRYSPAGNSFTDTVYNSAQGLFLYDVNGNLTVVRANAVRAELQGRSGGRLVFELFPRTSSTTGGRLIGTKAPDGTSILTFNYSVAASDTTQPAASKLLKSSASDLSGNTLSFSYLTLPGGASAVSTIGVTGGLTYTYGYDTSGNLASVTYPNGDQSTYTRSVVNGQLRIVFAEAGATGMHRNKTATYSNNIAADLLSWNNNERPAMYNQSSELVSSVANANGEYTWWGVTGTTASAMRKSYEGGNALRNTNENAGTTYYKSWQMPTTWNMSDVYGSIISPTQEAYGLVSSPGAYYANRAGIPPQITRTNGSVYSYLYDANGNMTMEKVGTQVRRAAFDPNFNKPTLQIDFSGHAQTSAYDSAGNLISQTVGLVADTAQGAGVPMPGLACSYYQTAVPFPMLASTTPNSVTAVNAIALGQVETNTGSTYTLMFKGSLTLPTTGARTFYLSAQRNAVLIIDGVQILNATYSNGVQSAIVNLTAGAHTITVNYGQSSGPLALKLNWSGPETVFGGTPAIVPIATQYLSHVTTANEVTVHSTPATSTDTWTYGQPGTPLAGLMLSHTDGAGKVTQYGYDSNRRLSQVQETGDSGSLVTVKTLTYDTAGNIASATDAVGRVLNYAYDSRNRLVKTTYGDNTTETTLYGTGVDVNLAVQTKDRNGSVTKIDYDASGRPVTTTRGYALADNNGAITQVLSNPSIETTSYLEGTTNPLTRTVDGKVTQYTYDFKNRLVATTVAPVQGVSATESTTISANEQPIFTTDAYGRRTFHAYRATDRREVRQIRELKPGSLGTGLTSDSTILAVARDTAANPQYEITDFTLDPDGRTIAQTDARGIVTTTAYDAAIRPASATRSSGLPEQSVTSMTYDGANRILTQTDGLGRVTTRTYTPAGRLASVVYPDGKHEDFTYYADGKLATRKDADGQTSTLTWSQCCGREFGSANPNGEGTLKFYDGAGHVTYAAAVKDVSAASGFVNWTGSGITLPSAAVVSAQTMKYDARGRIIASTKWNQAPAGVDPHNPPIAPTGSTDGFTTTYAYFDNLSDSRFADTLSKLAAKGITLTSGSATLVTGPAGEQSFSIADGTGLTVASGVFNK